MNWWYCVFKRLSFFSFCSSCNILAAVLFLESPSPWFAVLNGMNTAYVPSGLDVVVWLYKHCEGLTSSISQIFFFGAYYHTCYLYCFCFLVAISFERISTISVVCPMISSLLLEVPLYHHWFVHVSFLLRYSS